MKTLSLVISLMLLSSVGNAKRAKYNPVKLCIHAYSQNVRALNVGHAWISYALPGEKPTNRGFFPSGNGSISQLWGTKGVVSLNHKYEKKPKDSNKNHYAKKCKQISTRDLERIKDRIAKKISRSPFYSLTTHNCVAFARSMFNTAKGAKVRRSVILPGSLVVALGGKSSESGRVFRAIPQLGTEMMSTLGSVFTTIQERTAGLF